MAVYSALLDNILEADDESKGEIVSAVRDRKLY